MSTTRLTRVEQLFIDAIDLEPKARTTLLDERCGRDETIRREVERMLAAADASAGYFDALPHRFGVSRLRSGRDEVYEASVGQQFGQYRLTEQVGSGGMGAVWRAERADGRFEGFVAVKLLTRLHNKAALKHFDREAHYLAKLTHPNITRLIDAGIGPDDVPYLILEYVEGCAIDRWCDGQTLGINNRLRLLIQVANAVAHAHTRLVVHSDIKPSNVLITLDGTVKLLDFGVATLLDESAGDSAGTALTPEFAAPEQLADEPVSTATDVYALGMLLHVLLTGESPRKVDETTDLLGLRQAANRDPPSLATSVGDTTSIRDPELRRRAAERGVTAKRFLRALRSELDPIACKALAVDPEKRYRNASEFAADLRRYLDKEPLAALPHTVGYRARKFVARHRGGVLSALLTTLALVAALGLALQQMFVAREQRDVAQYERQRTLASNEFYGLLLEEMGVSDQPLTALELLDRGAALLQTQYGDNQPFMGRIQFDLSRRFASLAERDREKEFLELAERAARESGDKDLLASVLCASGVSLLQEDTEAAQAIVDEALLLFNRISMPSADERFHCVRLQARHAAASGERDRAIDILEAERQRVATSSEVSAHGNALLLTDLGQMHYRSGNFADTIDLLDEALAKLRAGGRSNTLTYQTTLGNKAVVLGGMGEYVESTRIQEEILARFDDAAWSGRRGQLARRVNYALNLVRLSRDDEALSLLEQAREQARVAGNTQLEAFAVLFTASSQIELKRFEAAAGSLREAEAILRGSAGVWQHHLRLADMIRAAIAREEGRFDEARALVMPMLDGHRAGELALAPPTLAIVLAVSASIDVEAGEFGAAEPFASEAIIIRQAGARDPDRSAHVGAALVLRAKARYGLGRTADAIADLERAIVSLGNGLGADNIETQEARELRASYREAH